MRNLVSSLDRAVSPLRVAVVGGGAAGVIAAVHLLREAGPQRPVDVRVIEEGAAIGPGLAYSAEHPLHTLNNFAGRLSAVAGEPDHLLRWCADHGVVATPTSFLPRATYGRYLTDVLEMAPVPDGSALRRTRGQVVDVTRDAGGLSVRLSCGWSVHADKVVLALGNPPPRRQREYESLGPRYVGDPWSADLVERIGGAREVLVLGTGLTMVDVVAQLHAALPHVRFTAVSRHGTLPAAHRPTSSRLHDVFDPGPAPLGTLVERIEARIAEVADVGGDWRDVIDSVRVYANDLWQGLSHADQERFVTRVARRWECVRHRMAPAMAAHVAELRQRGILRVARSTDVDTTRFDRVVNCTGPAPVPTRGWNPLVDSLLDRGVLRPHRLGLGVDMDGLGRPVGRSGTPDPDLWVVGAARRGVEWEVAAVPDLREQAARLAASLLVSGTADGTASHADATGATA